MLTSLPVPSFRIGEEAAGGLAAGIVGTVIGFPLDLIKTRMQTGTPGSILQVGTKILHREGFFALYKGVVPPLLSLSILNTLSFTSYAYFRGVYGGQDGWDPRNGLAGLTGAPLFGVISTVENMVKTQMQLDNTKPQRRFSNSWDCVVAMTREHGFGVLYTGHVVNTIREGAFVSCYFFVYEGYRELLVRTTNDPKMAIPVAGGLAGATSWAFSFPLDCVRAGVQGRDLSALRATNKGKGAIEVFNELMKTKGIRGLYSGVGPSIARAFLVSSSRFSAYEGALWVVRGGRKASTV